MRAQVGSYCIGFSLPTSFGSPSTSGPVLGLKDCSTTSTGSPGACLTTSAQELCIFFFMFEFRFFFTWQFSAKWSTMLSSFWLYCTWLPDCLTYFYKLKYLGPQGLCIRALLLFKAEVHRRRFAPKNHCFLILLLYSVLPKPSFAPLQSRKHQIQTCSLLPPDSDLLYLYSKHFQLP